MSRHLTVCLDMLGRYCYQTLSLTLFLAHTHTLLISARGAAEISLVYDKGLLHQAGQIQILPSFSPLYILFKKLPLFTIEYRK